jgi:hypothetical protein
MSRDAVEFESLYVRERPGGFETGNVWDRRAGADVEKDLVARQNAGPAIVQADLQCLRRHEPPIPDDQFGAGRGEVLHTQIDLAPNHIALAAEDRQHVGCDGTSHYTELPAVLGKMHHPRAPDLGLARHAGDIWAGAADPSALHKGRAPPGLGQVPGDQLASLSAAENQRIEVFALRHELPPGLSVAGRCLRCRRGCETLVE